MKLVCKIKVFPLLDTHKYKHTNTPESVSLQTSLSTKIFVLEHTFCRRVCVCVCSQLTVFEKSGKQ